METERVIEKYLEGYEEGYKDGLKAAINNIFGLKGKLKEIVSEELCDKIKNYLMDCIKENESK